MGTDVPGHPESDMTGRQQREKEYYDTYANIVDTDDVSFEPVEGNRRRPWNSYWYVYEMARKYYGLGKRRLLDFGCGPGVTSVRFAKIGYEVHGFDISTKNVEVGNNLARKYGLEGHIELTTQIAEKLDYPSGYFDMIVGFDILHHVNIPLAIAECKRVLTGDGVAIFREPVEAPFLNDLRNTKAVKYLVPNEKNFTPGIHITEDERILNQNDIEIIKKEFKGFHEERFTFTSRLDRFFRKYYGNKPSPLEMIDHAIFKIVPFARKLGGDAVFVLNK